MSTSNRRLACIEPRGLGALVPKLDGLERYAVTGSLASDGVAPARLARLHVDDAVATAETLELEPTDVGANVWLLEPFDDVVFERTVEMFLQGTTVTVAARSQVAVDLLTSPGRGPQEGETLVARIGGELLE